MIRMKPQWDRETSSILSQLARDRFDEAIEAPAPLIRRNVVTISSLEYEVSRSSPFSPPTRQACMERFAAYVKQLANLAERVRKDKRRLLCRTQSLVR